MTKSVLSIRWTVLLVRCKKVWNKSIEPQNHIFLQKVVILPMVFWSKKLFEILNWNKIINCKRI